MNWLFWRQHRKQIIFVGMAVLVYTAILMILGVYTVHGYHHAQATKNFDFTFSGEVRYMPLATIALPLLLGLFWGAPLIAKEYEEGTNTFAWTQGVTRRRWLTTKLGWILLVAGTYGTIISVASGWALRTENAQWFDRFEWVHFDVQGVMPIVYAVFAVALGVLIGALLKRTLGAVALTLGLFVILQFVMGIYVRPHYMTPFLTRTVSSYSYSNADGGNGTLLKNVTTGPSFPTNSSAWRLNQNFGYPQSINCPPNIQKGLTCEEDVTSLSYQPANRFWVFQGIESGIYIGLSAIFVGATYWLVLKRDA